MLGDTIISTTLTALLNTMAHRGRGTSSYRRAAYRDVVKSALRGAAATVGDKAEQAESG